ncbi:hypothetical protein Tco_1072263 [Tanacetum coccineum]
MIAGLGAWKNLGDRQANQFNRLAKVYFHKFNGEDVMGWIFKCDQFFLIDNTLEEEKVKIIYVHLFDKALLWHRQLIKTKRENVTWVDYKEAITLRFGSLVEVSEEHAIRFYLGGLPTKLEMAVRMFKPKTLSDAYCLTTLQEATLEAVKKKNNLFVSQNTGRFSTVTVNGSQNKQPLLTLPTTSNTWKPKSNTPVMKQLTQKEYEDKRSKNLWEEEEEYVDANETLDNVVSEEAKRLGCKIWNTCPLAVTVASEKQLVTTSTVKDFQWKLYGQTFTSDVLLLPLGGCDMVLGIQWLAALGDIKCVSLNYIKLNKNVYGLSKSLKVL